MFEPDEVKERKPEGKADDTHNTRNMAPGHDVIMVLEIELITF